MCYNSDDLIEIEDFDFDNFLLDEKPYENVLIYNISYEPWLVQNQCVFSSIKLMDLLEFMMELDI